MPLIERWVMDCEFCTHREYADDRLSAIAAGHQHVADQHANDDEWSFRVRGFSTPPVASNRIASALEQWEE